MIYIKVYFKNGDSLKTQINTDLEGARNYYIGKFFNMGVYPREEMTQAVRVELLK